jgi:hypothetical protein
MINTVMFSKNKTNYDWLMLFIDYIKNSETKPREVTKTEKRKVVNSAIY